MHGSFKLRGCLWIGAGIGFVVAIFLVTADSETRPCLRLPSGGQVTVVKLSYGRDHKFVPGTFWQRIVGGIATTNLAQKLGAKIDHQKTTSDELRVWLEVRMPFATNVPTLAVTILATNGLESRRTYMNRTINVSTTQTFYCFPVTILPRRTKEFGIRLYRQEKAEMIPVGEVTVKSPVRHRRFASWKPEPLPTVKTDHDELFVLTRFNTGLGATGLVTRMETSWTEINFEQPGDAFQRGLWIAERVEVWDATGNASAEQNPMGRIIQQSDKQYSVTATNGGVYLRGALWSDEPWRVRLELLQGRKSKFRAENLWTLTDLPLSGLPDTSSTIRTQIQNVRLELKALNSNQIRLDFFPPTNTFQLTVIRAFDQRGSNVVCVPAKAGRNERAFDLRLRAGAQRINCTFAVHRPHILEFVAQPTLLRTNVAYWARP